MHIVDSDRRNSANYLPENGWSTDSGSKFDSNVTNAMWRVVATDPMYNHYAAIHLDNMGVTADQFYEAWMLIGDQLFSLAEKASDLEMHNTIKGSSYMGLKGFLKETVMTKDLRFAYYLLSPSLEASPEDIVVTAKKMGYKTFFGYAKQHMSLHQIKMIADGDIDSTLIGALIEGYAA